MNCVAIGSERLGQEAKGLAECPSCGKRHRIRWGQTVMPDGSLVPSKTIGFVKCKGKSYLVAIAGRLINTQM